VIAAEDERQAALDERLERRLIQLRADLRDVAMYQFRTKELRNYGIKN
jgi:hypothetical protein